MAELKTKKTDATVDDFVAGIEDEATRADCETLAGLLKEATGDEGRMWGPSMAGFGEYRYRYDSGREGTWFIAGFSPRKANLTVYLMSGYEFDDAEDLLARLGKHSLGKSCLYIKRLSDIDQSVLKELIALCISRTKTAA